MFDPSAFVHNMSPQCGNSWPIDSSSSGEKSVSFTWLSCFNLAFLRFSSSRTEGSGPALPILHLKTPIAMPYRSLKTWFLVLWESKSLPFSKCPSVNAYDVPLHAKFRAVHTALTCTHHSHEKVDTSWFHVMPDALCDLRNCRAKTRLSLATPFILWCWEVVPRFFKSCATLRHNCVW